MATISDTVKVTYAERSGNVIVTIRISYPNKKLCSNKCPYIEKLVRSCSLFNRPLSITNNSVFRCDECIESFGKD